MIEIYKLGLLPSVLMTSELLSINWILQEDNDPKHVSKLCNDWKSQNNIQVLPWPSASPDLNPIENVWSFIKFKISKKKIKSIRQLKREILNIWNGFEITYAQNLVNSMKNRISSCISSDGDYICY